METTDKEAISQENKSVLQLERPLLPIDKYALREGMSKDMVEHFSKIGYLQIRKFKGKTYVLDIPISQYSFDAGSEESAQIEVETIETGERTEPQQDSADDSCDSVLGSIANRTAKIHEPLKKIFNKARGIVQRQQKNDSDKIKQKTDSQEPVQSKSDKETLTEDTQSKTDEVTLPEKHAELIHTPELERIVVRQQPLEAEPAPQAIQTFTNSEIQFELLAADARAKHSWQIGAAFLSAILLVSVCVTFWSLADRKVQVNKANQAYAGMYQLVNNSSYKKKQGQLLQDELNISEATIANLRSEKENSTAEIERLQKELDASRADVKLIRNKLNLAKKIHDAVQEKNAKTLNELTEQFQGLKSRLNEMLKQP